MIIISGNDLKHLRSEMTTIAENQRLIAESGQQLADVSRMNFKLIVGLMLTVAALSYIIIRRPQFRY